MLEQKTLAYLEQHRGSLVTGGQLARQLGVSRTAVWKTIHTLAARGHAIQTLPNRGYRLSDTSDGLSQGAISALLTTQRFGRQLELHETLDSTNTYLKNRDTTHLPEGFTVIANGQTAGRGRLGRTFCSPTQEGVYLSVLLKPAHDLSQVTLLTLCAAVAVCRAVEAICGLKPGIKWVNDIYLEDKKLCGILTEALVCAELGRVESMVVGIGVNTGLVDPSLGDSATSIYAAKGLQGIRNPLAAEILNQFEGIYGEVLSGEGRAAMIAAYNQHLFIVGRWVKVIQASRAYRAQVMGIDDTGALLVKTEDSQVIPLRSGEIALVQQG